MKKLFKIFVPPTVAFLLYFIAVRYSPYYFTLRIDSMGDGKLQSFMSFYRYLFPLIFVTGILTQLLLFIPIWNKVAHSSDRIKWFAFIGCCFLCFILGSLVAYAIWDEVSRKHLYKLCLFLTGVQVIYWIINIAITHLLENKFKQTASKTVEKPEI